MPRTKHINWYRKPLQWIVVALLAVMVGRWWIQDSYVPDFEAVCPLGGLQALSSFAVSNSLACSMTALQIAMALALAAGVLAAGKLFCSMLCPLGTLTEWFGRLGSRLGLRLAPQGTADRLLRAPKYALLFATFYFTIESSELFCRTFDPYYAGFTGFSADVDMLYAIPALIILILGSVFVRQAWCRYFCPLGAVTNLFTWILPVAGLTLAWFGANALGAQLSWIWLLGGLSLLGFVMEAVTMKGGRLAGLRVQRVDAVCTGCRKCDRACPMGIDISRLEPVRHIDCHLCTDCVDACPERGALLIARSARPWLPGVLTVALIAVGLTLGATMRIPTISKQWGDERRMAAAGVLDLTGMKSIKCFGSSTSFATRMRQVDGVLGVETYVGDHSVRIWYNKNLTTAAAIREAIYEPTRYTVQEPGDSEPMAMVECGIDKLFDPVDHFTFEEILIQHGGVYAVETHFGEPVRARIWYNPTRTTPERLRSAIEAEEVRWETSAGFRTETPGFIVRSMTAPRVTSVHAWRASMFEPVDVTFNSWSSEDTLALGTLDLAMPQVETARDSISYLVSHLSDDPGIVRLQTLYAGAGPTLRLWYHPRRTTPARIRAALASPRLYVLFDDGKTGYVNNPFR